MIRPYKSSDKERLVELLRLNTPAYFAPEEESDYLQYLDHLIESYYVVEEDGVVLGCGGINYVEEGRVARISWDIIHPDSQGKGLGSKLTEFRISKIRENPEVERISVRTTQLVSAFYERLGFKLVEIKPDFWAKGFDLYRMEMQLK